MAWDFATEPDFQEHLDWMRDLVRDEVWPIETVFDDLGYDGFKRAIAPAAGAGEGARPVGGAPAAGPRRPGLRAGQARADARDPRHEPARARRVRQRRARQRQQRDPRARGHAGPEGALPAPAARGRPAQRVLDDRARHRGLRSHAAADARGQGRRRLGHQRPQVVLHQRLDRRLPDRDGGHRPRRAPAPARLDVHRRRRHAGREHHPRRRDDGAPGARRSATTATTPRSATRTCACPPTRCSAARARAS